MSDTSTAGTGFAARKPIRSIVAEAERPALARTLGIPALTALGIGQIIGAGIFVLTGTAAARFAGPGVVLSFLISGTVSAFVALCYAELAAMLPVGGSTYTYAYATIGELAAWIIGWDLMLEYTAGAATVAVGWSGYAVSLLGNFGIVVPPALAHAPGTAITLANGTHAQALFNLPAVGVIAALILLLILGTRESTRFNLVLVSIKLVVVVTFIAVGVRHVHPANWVPLVPPNQGGFGHFGASGLLRAAGVVFYAYIGFDSAATAAGEARRPQRDVPISLIAALAVCTVLYVLVSGILTGIVPYTSLNVPDPIARAVDMIGLGWFAVCIKVGALIGLTTVILVGLYGQSRILFTMAQDGMLPQLLARVHPRFGTPFVGLATIGVCAAAIAGLLPITVLSELVSIGTLFAFIVVCAAVIWLRRSDPRVRRPFRVPAVPWVPGLGALFSLGLMAGLPLVTWLRLVAWLALGLVAYFAYGRRHARRHREAAAVGPRREA